jgi:purine-binding chemotaxis protein CheW
MQREYCTFYLGDELFGVDVLLVREIHCNFDMTPVDRAPAFVAGVMNLRGQVITIIDPGVQLGLDPVRISSTSGCLVLKTIAELQRLRDEGFALENTAKDAVGLLADAVGDMAAIEDSDIKPPPANVGRVDGKYIKGVVQLDTGLLVILKVDDVLTPDGNNVKSMAL